MTGYCESCAEVVDSVVDEIGGGDVCPNCMDDVHPGVHIEDCYMGPDEDDEVEQWLNNECDSY